jgi:Bacterial mobilisation protein (MobC).
MVQLLSNSSNNLNQIAKRINADDSIFAGDITDIQENKEPLVGSVRRNSVRSDEDKNGNIIRS